MTRRLLLDANVLVRFLVSDIPEQSDAVKRLFLDAQNHRVTLSLDSIIIAETIYVLTSYYRQPRSKVAEILSVIVDIPYIDVEQRQRMKDALMRYNNKSVDFADAWLAAGAKLQNVGVASFDRDFDKFDDVVRFKPSSK